MNLRGTSNKEDLSHSEGCEKEFIALDENKIISCVSTFNTMYNELKSTDEVYEWYKKGYKVKEEFWSLNMIVGIVLGACAIGAAAYALYKKHTKGNKNNKDKNNKDKKNLAITAAA